MKKHKSPSLNRLFKLIKKSYSHEEYTHTSFISPKGKYLIQDPDIDKFWKDYSKYISLNLPKNRFKLGLAEKTLSSCPVTLELELDTPPSNYNILQLIEIYQTTLNNLIKNCKPHYLTCFYLEKDSTKFQLHFPYIFLSNIDHEVYFFPIIRDKIRFERLFQPAKIIKFVDCINKKYWLLYGSKRTILDNPFLLTSIYNHRREEINLEEVLKKYKLYTSKGQSIDLKEKGKEFYLPQILSVIPGHRKNLQFNRKMPTTITNRKTNVYKTRINIEDRLNMVQKLLLLIRESKSNIGQLIYNIGEGSDEALRIWLEYEKKKTTYEEGELIHKWINMTKTNLNINTFKYYAKNDCPEEYKQFILHRSEIFIRLSLNNSSHNAIAKALYEMYGDEFTCASIKKKIWYQFRGHKWVEIEDGVYLREKISGELTKRYAEIAQIAKQEMAQNQFEDEKAMYNRRIKSAEKIIAKLGSSTFKSNIMKECMEVFYDEDFLKRLDANPLLIGFKNGIYDLTNDKFRDGFPDDFLSKNMSIIYKDFTPDDAKVQEVHDFLEKVFPDKSLRKYFLDTMSNIFEGGNPEKIIQFWIGEGDNAKSITQKIIEKMLGPSYAVKLPTTVVTTKKPATGSAVPELARTGNGVRWVSIEEPDGDESLRTGLLKMLTGGDSYFCRGLWKEGGDVEPMFKLIFICNKEPKIHYHSCDKAVWSRIRVLPFESIFYRDRKKISKEVPRTLEEQLKKKKFIADKQFKRKISKMLRAFAWVLLNHRKNIKNQPVEEPEKVLSATHSYRQRNDVYNRCIDEIIREEEGTMISITDFYMAFQDWWTSEGKAKRDLPDKTDVKEQLTKMWGKPLKGGFWKGYTISTIDDMIEEEGEGEYNKRRYVPKL